MKSNIRLAGTIVTVIIGMACLAYASVPLYSLFCKVTGYGGTPRINEEYVAVKKGTRHMIVRFNSDISPDLNWDFAPLQNKMEVITGERNLAFFTAQNNSEEPIKGVAVFNVTPQKAGKYFNKIECFCFTEQTLKPHEKVEMPVSFFLDADLEDDIEMKDVDVVTLSYTFFPADK